MAKKTTVKAVALRYGEVGGAATTPLMGVLKGLTVGQDEPDATEIEAEFFDTPFDIIYDGNPITFNFELANYDLSELPALFGGTTESDVYEGAASATTTEHSWQLEFSRGNFALYIYKGLTVGTIKKDEDGALNFSVTITALTHETTTGTGDKAVTAQHMYKIIGTKPQNP